MQVSKRRKINDAKDKNVTESGSDKRIPRNRGRLPKSGKDLDDGKLFYDYFFFLYMINNKHLFPCLIILSGKLIL